MTFPSDPLPDASLALLFEGYEFSMRRYARLGGDAFTARVMLKTALFTRGADAARMFYTPGRFTRQGGIPRTALWSLQDTGSEMAIDEERHRHRKAMMMRILNGGAARQVADAFEGKCHRAAPSLRSRRRVVLLDVMRRLLTEALCDWAGAPLSDRDAARRAAEFGAMVNGAGSVGPRNWRDLLLRRRTERWARNLIRGTREGGGSAPDGSALAVISRHRDLDGELLDIRTAGVELINCIRPTVATDRYMVFSAHALHTYPAVRAALGDGADEQALERFANEVRRFYPFIPMMGGRVIDPFEWRGRLFSRGDWVLFDLYGTNHDPRLWDAPERFDPERFRGHPPRLFDLVSHGAGDPNVTHRCPGEAMNVELIKRAARLLLRTPYTVPDQDLRIDMHRIPAAPKSRMIIELR